MFYKSKVHIRFKLRTSKRGGQSAVWPPWTWDILGSQGWIFLTVSRLKLRKGCSRERSFPEAWSILMLGEEDMCVPAGHMVLGSGVLLAQLGTTTDLITCQLGPINCLFLFGRQEEFCNDHSLI